MHITYGLWNTNTYGIRCSLDLLQWCTLNMQCKLNCATVLIDCERLIVLAVLHVGSIIMDNENIKAQTYNYSES